MTRAGPSERTPDMAELTAEQIELRDQAFQNCAVIFAYALADMDRKTPEQAARDAYMPGGPTVEELTAIVVRLREKGRSRARSAA
jgi:hypothetical protein